MERLRATLAANTNAKGRRPAPRKAPRKKTATRSQRRAA